MDKTTKFILGLIAVSLIGINVQMWDGKLIKDTPPTRINESLISFNVCWKEGRAVSAHHLSLLSYNAESWGGCD